MIQFIFWVCASSKKAGTSYQRTTLVCTSRENFPTPCKTAVNFIDDQCPYAYRSDDADELRMLFLSQDNNYSTVIVVLSQKNVQKAFSAHLQHLTLTVNRHVHPSALTQFNAEYMFNVMFGLQKNS